MQHTTMMPPKSDCKKSESLIASKGCDRNDKRNHKRWWQQTSSSSMPSEKDWTDTEDRNAKRLNSGCGGSFTDKSIDGLRKSRSNPCSVDQGSSSMSAHWEVGDKKETGGWRSWDGAVFQKIWQPSSVNRKIGWNEPRGLNALELADSCNENSYRKHNLDGSGEFSPKYYSTDEDQWQCNKCRQCTSGSFRSPRRDWKGFNDRSEIGHISGWDEPFIHNYPDEWSKFKPKTRFDNRGRSRKCGQWKDGDTTKATNRWSRWDVDASQKNQQFPRFPSRNDYSNVFLRWAASESGDFGENVYRDPGIVWRGDPWKHQSLKLPPNCDWKNFSGFTASNGNCFDRDCKKLDPCLDQNGRAPTKQLSPTSSLNSAWCKPESCKISESKISFTEKMECSPPNLTDQLPEVARKTLQWSRSRIPSPVWKHRQPSWDQRDKGAGAAPNRDCLSKSRRCIQFKYRCGVSFRACSHEDTAQIVENKGVQHHRRYSDHAYENLLGHRDHSQDTLHRTGLDTNESRNDKSSNVYLKERYSKGSNTAYNYYDTNTNDLKEHGAVDDDKAIGKWDPIMSNAKFLSFNDLKFRETTVDKLACSNSISDTDGFRNETINSMTKTTDLIADEDEWKNQNKCNTCDKRIQKVGPLLESQNDPTLDSTSQLSENLQLNSQFPCPQSSIPGVVKHQPVIEHGSNQKDQVQNRQQAAFSSEVSSKKNKDVNYTSPSKRLVPEPIVGEGNDSYRHMTTNLAKQAMVGNDLANDLCGIMSHPSYKNLMNAHPETSGVQADAEDKDRKDKKTLGNYGLDDKVRVFKFALAEFVKEIIKPFWKEGRLSKEAHKIVVKKVVDKVIGVLCTNIPVTQESIKLYLSFSKDKLTKLAQAYLEKVVNT